MKWKSVSRKKKAILLNVEWRKERVTEMLSEVEAMVRQQKKLLTDLGQIIRSRITRAHNIFVYVLMRDLSHKNGRTR